MLLPVGRDALSRALRETFPDWTIAGLTAAAYAKAQETDDYSLVGLAARARDPVALAALRESVVLYAEDVMLGIEPSSPEYEWAVEEELSRHAKRFIDTFNSLFGETLPSPDPVHAERYWRAYDDNDILGRCVRLGGDDRVMPPHHYHWIVSKDYDGTYYGRYYVKESWNSEVWTTARYRAVVLRR
jgi:hypothetical protein